MPTEKDESKKVPNKQSAALESTTSDVDTSRAGTGKFPDVKTSTIPQSKLPARSYTLGITDETVLLSIWAHLDFEADAESRVKVDDVMLRCREFFGYHSPRRVYVSDKRIIDHLIADFKGTKALIINVSGVAVQVLQGIDWHSRGLHDHKAGSKGKKPSHLGTVIISAPPEMEKILQPKLRPRPSGDPVIKLRPKQLAVLCIRWSLFTFEENPVYALDYHQTAEIFSKALSPLNDRGEPLSPQAMVWILKRAHKHIREKEFVVEGNPKKLLCGLKWRVVGKGEDREAREDLSVVEIDANAVTACDCHKASEKDKCTARDEEVSKWLSEVFTREEGAIMDPIAIHEAYSLVVEYEGMFTGAPTLEYDCLMDLIDKTFPHLGKAESADIHREDYNFKGLRWTALENSKSCVAIASDPPLGLSRRDAHKLLYLPQPARTIAWLRMSFKETDPSATVTCTSVMVAYSYAFHRSKDTHPLLPERDFINIMGETFRSADVEQVTPGHAIILGLMQRPLSERWTPEQQIKRMRQKRLSKFQESGRLPATSTPNVFNQKLLQDNLLMVPHYQLIPAAEAHERDYNPPPDIAAESLVRVRTAGPFIERLGRRGNRKGREPLGDEEPGFPGISMKVQQRRFKKAYTTITQHMEKLTTKTGDGETGKCEGNGQDGVGCEAKCLDNLLPLRPIVMKEKEKKTKESE